MARSVKPKVVIAGLLAALAACFLVAVWRSGDAYELYIRRSARVFQDGHELADAWVFKGQHGHLLLTLRTRRSAALIYFPEAKGVGDCNSHTFLDLVVVGVQKHSRDGHYPCAGPGKQELRQDITDSEGAFAFNRWDDTVSDRICRMEIRGDNISRHD